MPFRTFLKKRRELIAQTIREAYDQLAGHRTPSGTTPPVADLVGSGETDAVEFKSTLRTNLHTGERDARMENTVLRTIAGFLNMNGGTLIVGVADDGSPVGLQADGFADEDKMALHLINLLKDRLGGQHAISVHPRFDDHAGVRVLVIECDRSRTPVFVKDGQAERFFVRYGPSTQELTGAAAQTFIRQRFS
jgi:predicted HTH transcriptional regulator